MPFCPCGSGRSLDECCGPIIGGAPASTPEALMRARYTAFLQGNVDFLEATLAPEKRDGMDRDEVARSARDAEGMGMEFVTAGGGGLEDEEAALEYRARFRFRGRDHLHHERATFRREGGAWMYVEGEVNPKGAPVRADKVGRNDPCPCGSGKKFKKCCGG